MRCDAYGGACGAAGVVDVVFDTYAYDQNANVVAITDGTTTAQRGNRDMTYDGLDRLRTADSALWNGVAEFRYDVLDNLVYAQVPQTPMTPARTWHYCRDPASNLLTNVMTGSCTGTTVMGLGYDARGNVINKNGVAYDFDVGNRLRKVVGQEHYRYDGLGRRVLQWSATGLGNLLSQYDRAGRLVYQHDERVGKGVEHVYLGDRLVARRERNVPGDINIAVTYLHTDALGSPVVATDASRTEVQRSDYEPFGLLTNRANDNRAGYTGHVMDAVTGLTYMEQRYYDPKLGLFLSADPVTAFTTPGSNFNRYWYANNNPYKFTDPDGRFVQALWGASVGAIVDIAAQKIANPDKPINWKSVGVSAAVGAVSGGVASVARVAAIRGTLKVGQAVAATAATNAAVGAAGSAADSAVNGESISAEKMALAAVANGGLSLAAGLAGARGVLVEKMASGSPTSPRGIGDHILGTTQSAGGSIASTSAVQGAASTGGRVVDIAKEAAVSAAQKKVEERIK